ncbi:MAG: undecaprenyl-diphosphate phosphatase [Planctomycetota bacterium]|nr:MAG: undecaprenyl-diphosphate phosphatase [Planctomycetota bacterium]
MNDYVSAILLGIVEGLTEFLPVSSTAHLRLSQQILNLPLDDAYWKMFAIVIQLGAILAVVVYFRRRLSEFCRTFIKPAAGDRWRHPVTLVMLSFVVTAVPCLLMDELIGENLENLMAMGIALIVGGIAMWVVDRTFRHPSTDRIEEMSLRQAIAIGLFQILAAAFPGVSRSMATIAGGQIAGLSRPAALEFSFFLSIPVMVAATVYKLLQYLVKNPTAVTPHDMAVLGVGFAVSFVVAWAVIAWFMHWVRRHGFAPFAIYRILVGAALLYWLFRQS